MSKITETKNILQKISNAFVSNQFQHYIEYIRFPHFKNLKSDSKIDFGFPFTVFTGLNGSGKSSTLHAVYGAPEGKSTGEFWFSTKVDPIKEDKGAPNCFVYGYKNPSGNVVEVLKTRVGQAKGADYWEPSRPLVKYGMQTIAGGGRNPAIKKNVIYLDFRAELSAFDQYFYFGSFHSSKTLKSKQDVLRKYSKFLKKAIDNDTIEKTNKRKNKLPVELSPSELSTISKILGKTYQKCKLLTHDFYGTDGVTIYFNTNQLDYSEAYAGRGEYAVVKLVYEVNRAVNNSLIILDEPEVSLHPGAQEELKLFLLNAVLTKKLQVIISTHSPKFVEFLPDEAIKLFIEDSTSKFIVKNTCNYFEAFQNIGIELSNDEKNIIIVEDVTAQMILENMLKELGNEFSLLFKVKYYPGGAEEIYKKGVTYSEEEEYHKFIFLDGDKRKPQFNPENFTQKESDDLDFLKQKLIEETNISIERLGFRIDGNKQGGNSMQKKASAKNYMKYLHSNLYYLPNNIPEEIIWNTGFATKQLKNNGLDVPIFTSDLKQNFMLFSNTFIGDAIEASLNAVKKIFIREFIKEKNDDFQYLSDTLKKLKDLVTA